MTSPPVRIGLSANYLHADPDRALYRNKTLLYAEQRMVRAVAATGALPIFVEPEGDLAAYLDLVDGVVLTGGADVAPQSYGQTPIENGAWPGDPERDAFEIELVKRALARPLPVFAICRGIQILNVALGGTLYQDITTQRPQSLVHRDWERYDILEHPVTVEPDSFLARCYPGRTELLVNSIHHQGLDRVASGLRVTSRAPDEVVEAVELPGADALVVGVQWHPEWLDHDPAGGSARSPGAPLFAAFTEAVRRGRAR